MMRKQVKAFTLVEMLIVLGVISILVLLFVPNLSKQNEGVRARGQEAIEKVVDTQIELFKLEYPQGGDEDAVMRERLTPEQYEVYRQRK